MNVITIGAEEFIIAESIICQYDNYRSYFGGVICALFNGVELQEMVAYNAIEKYKNYIGNSGIDNVIKYIASFRDKIPSEKKEDFINELINIGATKYITMIIDELKKETSENKFIAIGLAVNMISKMSREEY